MVSTDSDYTAASPQRRWLEEELTAANTPGARASQPWLIVTGHKPIYCSSADADNSRGPTPAGRKLGSAGHQILSGLEALYQRYNVDLVLAGHIHEYERSLPVGDNGTVVETHHHTNASFGHYVHPELPTYLTIGMGGYPHTIGGPNEWPRGVAWSATHKVMWGYTRLHFLSGTKLKIEFVANGIQWKPDGRGNGLPAPGKAVPRVEDTLLITKAVALRGGASNYDDAGETVARDTDTDASPVHLMPGSPRSLKADDAEAIVKVEPSAPVLVVSGPAEGEKPQVNGQLWFPALLYRLGGEGTDNLLLSFKTDCDCSELPIDVGMNGRDFFSGDSGKHWSEVKRIDDSNEATGLVRPCLPAKGGTTVCLTRTVHSHAPVARAADNRTAYLAAQVFSSSGRQVKLFNASLSFPFELGPYPRGGAFFTYSLGTDGNTLAQPDGNTLMTLYGSVAGASVIVAMRTVDGGRHWDYHGTVANSTDNSQEHVSPNCSRPTETSMTLLGDEKTILSVWRSIGTNHPLCATTSTTLGKSWSSPHPLKGPYGVEPKIIRLKIGVQSVLVISSGRVGLSLHFSGDGGWAGEWQAFNLAAAHNLLVEEPDQHFPSGFVNGTQTSCRTAALACSTSYTGLTQLHGPSAKENGGGSADILVSYDLINSHSGLNYIYVMRLSLRLAGGAMRVTPHALMKPKLKPDDGGSHTTAGKDLRVEKTGGSVSTLPLLHCCPTPTRLGRGSALLRLIQASQR
jgi:hypothetical protein